MNSNTSSIKKLYYSIGEVSKVTELKQYVLRYWETEFKQLNPSKNKAGNRTYRQKDIDVILNIKDLLYNQKFTIDGARKMLSVEQSTSTDDSKSESNPEINLDVFFSIRQILLFQAGYYGVPKKLAEDRVDTILKKLDLYHKRNETSRHLSGGMKRRLLMAKALSAAESEAESPIATPLIVTLSLAASTSVVTTVEVTVVPVC